KAGPASCNTRWAISVTSSSGSTSMRILFSWPVFSRYRTNSCKSANGMAGVILPQSAHLHQGLKSCGPPDVLEFGLTFDKFGARSFFIALNISFYVDHHAQSPSGMMR